MWCGSVGSERDAPERVADNFQGGHLYRVRARGGWLAVLGALVLLAGCAAPEPGPSILTGTVIVGVVEDSPGFGVGDLNPAGFDIDLMNAIGAGLHTPVTPKPFTIADREPMLDSRNVTIVIATYSITPARNQRGIDFAGPYMVNPQALLIRADDTSITTKDSLRGKSVCTEAGGTGGKVDIPGANMTSNNPTTKECVDNLLAHNTDAVFTDALILYGYKHANPGKFKVVLPGVFGEQQYYGIGLLGHHHADCLKLNAVISDYLRTQWKHDFQAELPDAVAAYPGSDTSRGDFESQFKPKDSDMAALSCKL
ncbi:MAG: transporter substrate-binding domain-containing protein [Pseudonocardiaceae bacterium]